MVLEDLVVIVKFKSLEVRKSKIKDNLYYFLTIEQKGIEKHLCIFDDKAFENEIDKFKTLSQGTNLKLVCNYNYKYNKANLSINKVEIWKSN